MSNYKEEFNQLGIRHFTAEEFLYRGGSDTSGGCQGKNTDIPEELWENSFQCALVWDEIRERLGKPISITSHYRSPEYNSCIGGASSSYHMQAIAADAYSSQATAHEIWEVAQKLRHEGFFVGGIGSYPGFCHVDNRGTSNVDWSG